MEMFCSQCEETAHNDCCSSVGVCGKAPEEAALQDLIVWSLSGLAQLSLAAARRGLSTNLAALIAFEGLFKTVTNVDLDPDDLAQVIRRICAERDSLLQMIEPDLDECERASFKACRAVDWQPPESVADMVCEGQERSFVARIPELGEDLASLEQLLLHGLKGMAAYAHHAADFGWRSKSVDSFTFETLATIGSAGLTKKRLFELCMRCGEENYKVMQMLSEAHAKRFGVPSPVLVERRPRLGKAILVSGHDLIELEALLQQCAGTEVMVYTHSEMLPAHGYPKLREFANLAGNLGGAWHQQNKDFRAFPGAILVTTNCLTPPHPSYQDRLFTSGPVRSPGIPHIATRDFSALIARAQELPGFDSASAAAWSNEAKTSLPNTAAEESVEAVKPGELMTGFGHEAILGLADSIVGLVKSGQLKGFHLVGGCDGRKQDRDYYREYAEQVPPDHLILTLGCAKFRLFSRDYGNLAGIPRLLDMGQCNDAYSAIQVALALAKAFDCGVNDLPLHLNISWYEQKAVAILLTLLQLGLRKIRLGPTLPGFLSAGLQRELVEGFGLKTISTARADLERICV